MQGIPIPDGKDAVYQLGRERLAPKRYLSFGEGVKSLAPFQQRFAFFTPAIAYLHGRFTDRVLLHYLETVGPVDLFHTKFDRPLFSGLSARDGDPDWNYVLWAVEQEHWPSLVDHLCAAVATDTPTRCVYRYPTQQVELFDPLVLSRQAVLPRMMPVVDVTVFGVQSNRGIAYLEPVEPAHLRPLPLRFGPPDPECLRYAEALFCHEDPHLLHEDPYDPASKPAPGDASRPHGGPERPTAVD